MRPVFFLALICFNTSLLFGQNNSSDVNVRNDRVKTVQLTKEDWNLSYPIIKLNSNEKLKLQFDILSDQAESFYYTFVHCDKDWNNSNIFIGDYLEGFEENPLDDYKSSFNTTVSYYHYSLVFPNERAGLKLSGNYLILVYEPGKKDDPVLTCRFIVTENAGSIEAIAQRPRMAGDNYQTHQQIDFTYNYSGIGLNDPFRNIYASILQNGKWGTSKNNLKADFQGNNDLKYSSLSDKVTFPGGNEFRYFDIKSIRYKSENVRDVEFLMSNYNVFLQPSDNREFKPYFYSKDINGKYIIAYQEGQDPETDADYVFVYFTLPGKEINGGEIYVSGAFNNWRLDSANKMFYNPLANQYESTILLKQGWYNYEYVFLKKGDQIETREPFEGNHFETENDYIILIYYRNPRERFDRVLCTKTVNTLNNIKD
ncbi:MAG TPA: DUF5103 domain-containing protein [Bacteroidales bacterium]|nr:DUF5103 domain-containing protein [Bacteroidales bacterium]